MSLPADLVDLLETARLLLRERIQPAVPAELRFETAMVANAMAIVARAAAGRLPGAAEAAGSVAVIMFMAGNGQYGVGPLGEVASLSALVFQVRYGPKYLRDAMRPYQFSAALLLVIITMGLTVSALVLRARIAKRFRGV